MNDMAYDKKGLIKYLIWSFLLAWMIQAGVSVLYRAGYTAPGQFVTAAMMFVPMFSVLLAGHKLKGMGWRPHIKKNVKMILLAWFLPAALTAIGAALYFMVFSNHFDLSGAYMAESVGENVLREMEAEGITYPLYILSAAVGCLTYAPLVNMFFGIGEEVGWRGFLYPQLKAKYGRKKGVLAGGVIWGIWHWPLIWLIGYEYGTDYVGFPVTGMLLFCVITVSMGIICDRLYERSRSIWIPAVFHGAFNAAATLPLAVCATNTGSLILLGPAPIGILAGLPLIISAVILYLKPDKTRRPCK